MIEEVHRRIAAAPELWKELKGIIQFDLEGAYGFITVAADKVTVEGGKHDKADVTLTLPVLLLSDIIAGREDAQMAFYDQRLKIKGAQTIAVALFRKVLR